MVTQYSIVTAEGEKPASALALRRTREALAEQAGMLQTLSVTGAQKLRLWDCVDESWLLNPVPDYQVYQICLRQIVIKCSACKFTALDRPGFEGAWIRKHLAKVRGDAEQHEGAALTAMPALPGQPFRESCSGCGATFSRRNAGQKHIANVLGLFSQHKGPVEELRLRRYSLGPGESTILKRTEVQGGIAEPEASQEVRSLGERKRNRSRGRNRRRRNVGRTD